MTITRIVLDADYSIDCDDKCYTLVHTAVITGGAGRGSHLVKPENIGKIKETDCGYYGNVSQALVGYINKAPLKATSIDGVISAIKSAEETIKKVMEKKS